MGPLAVDGDARPDAVAPCIVGNPSPDPQRDPASVSTEPTPPGPMATWPKRPDAMAHCAVPTAVSTATATSTSANMTRTARPLGRCVWCSAPLSRPALSLGRDHGRCAPQEDQRSGDERGLLVLTYPDPVTSPDMFCIYRDYFEAGFLPVEERDRATITAILAEAALDLDG
ncbi:hypothetical protein pclt_cds_765 [Pandoravirus celtis]|uniref:Uncharacterized protein n=1 Tax=Pandoravirus celtis TaxID=2568002 RepID=A0A4D6EHR1_9VIRU|nr:hypothetical protein pclt_cds_765 [Pandoravirus celtis]